MSRQRLISAYACPNFPAITELPFSALRFVRFASLLICFAFACAGGCEMFDKDKGNDRDARGMQAGTGKADVARNAQASAKG